MPENEPAIEILKRRVESVVRPLRAGDSRKDRMREELLAHLQEVFEQEQDRSDEASALDRTFERFGAPGQLRRELQASVPTLERLFCTRLPGAERYESWDRQLGWIRPAETPAHHALRLALFAGSLAYGIILLAMVPTWLICVTFNPEGPRPEASLSGALLLGLLVDLVFFLGLGLCVLAGHKMVAATRGVGSSGNRLLLWGGFCAATVMACGLAMAGLLAAFVDIVWAVDNLLLLAAVTLIVPPAALWVMTEDWKNRRRYRDWGRLEIEP